MMFDIVLDRSAKDNYDRLDVNMTARVNDALNIISQNPFFGPNIKKLRGKYRTGYRYRVGNYRIVYSINTELKKCIIRGILRHDQAYR